MKTYILTHKNEIYNGYIKMTNAFNIIIAFNVNSFNFSSSYAKFEYALCFFPQNLGFI